MTKIGLVGWICYAIGISQIIVGDILNTFIPNVLVQCILIIILAIIGNILVRFITTPRSTSDV